MDECAKFLMAFHQPLDKSQSLYMTYKAWVDLAPVTALASSLNVFPLPHPTPSFFSNILASLQFLK